MKAIILAGGAGTRLHPLTRAASKQLLPVYNKPMVYYPLSTLMLAGFREFLLISTPEDVPRFCALLGDGAHLGIRIAYAVQEKPDGIPQAFLIADEFLAGSGATLILGDNLFFGHRLPEVLRSAAEKSVGATIFGYSVRDPERYGIVEFDRGKAVRITEKPTRPASRYAIPGLYFYDHRVVDIARQLRPSTRGELEITDLNNIYLAAGELEVRLLGRGIAWLDTGTHQALLEASNFVALVEQRQGLLIGSIEEVAFRMGYIDTEQLRRLAKPLQRTEYGEYLSRIADEGIDGD